MLVDADIFYSQDILISFAPFRILDNSKYIKWINSGFSGNMSYLSKNDSLMKREDPSLIMRNLRTIITFAINYKRNGGYDERYGKISKYALGLDYHLFVPKIIEDIIEKRGLFKEDFKIYTDTGPIKERQISFSSGLGWIGKNSMLINKTVGSFTYLGEALTDLKINNLNFPSFDLCGTCNRCIVSCPTSAINPDRTIDARKCLSYNNIENRDLIPRWLALKMSDMIFGCDICNDVCPWNLNSKPSKIKEVTDFDFGRKAKIEELAFIEKESFSKIFKNSAIKRVGFEGMARNAVIALYNRDKSDPILKEVEKNFKDLRTKEIKILKNQA